MSLVLLQGLLSIFSFSRNHDRFPSNKGQKESKTRVTTVSELQIKFLLLKTLPWDTFNVIYVIGKKSHYLPPIGIDPIC